MGVLLAALLRCSERTYTDDRCYTVRPPWGTEPLIGLFHRDGRPAFRDARVWVTYDGRSVELVASELTAAELLPNGRQAEYLVEPPDRAGNLFQFSTHEAIALFPCAMPLHYRVEAEGCAPVAGSVSWNDNTYPGRPDFSFHVPVRLDCTTADLPLRPTARDAGGP